MNYHLWIPQTHTQRDFAYAQVEFWYQNCHFNDWQTLERE